MNRSGSILIAAVSAGILVAGAVATVAIVQGSQTVPQPAEGVLVIDPSSARDPVASGPSFQPEALPEILLSSPDPAGATPAAKVDPPAISPAVVDEPSTSISALKARNLVTAAAPGTVVSVRKTTRGGFDSFAVKVKRSDGSTVTGYVNRADGMVFDWTQSSAPAPATYGGDDGDDADDHDGDDD